MTDRIQYDFHTHTIFSHGKGTIEDNARAAREKGLTGIAIADHGPGHLLYGVDPRKIPLMREEISRLRLLFPEMELYLSVEANIADTENGLDLSKEAFAAYDFVIAGYHFGIKGGYSGRNFLHHLSRGALPGKNNLLKKNTEMVVRAIYENPIRILTHPGDKGPFDIVEIAKACADRGTLLEISAWHSHLTVEEIRQAARTDARFIISSDAHAPEQVGVCAPAIRRAREAGLDLGRVVNIAECAD